MEGELWGLHGKETGDDSGGEDRRDQLNFKHVSTALHLINSVRHSSGAWHFGDYSNPNTHM